MTTSCLTYSACAELPCKSALPADVILCVPTAKVAPHACANSEVPEQPYEYRFIEAQLTAVKTTRDSCQFLYLHTICYDDAVIAEGETLEADDVTGVFCKGCIAQFIEDTAGNEVALRENDGGTLTLITQHGCEYTFSPGGSTGFSVDDTESVNLSLTGVVLTADVNVSADVGNALTVQPDGLFVPPASGVTVSDTATVDMTLTGADISADVAISADLGNAVTAVADGLFVQDVTVTDSNSIDFGISAGNITADAAISAVAGNQLTIEPDGLYAAPFTDTLTVSDTSSVDMSLTINNISSVVKISGDIGNCIEVRPDGLYAPCSGGGGGGAFSAMWVQTGEDKVTQDELRATDGDIVTNYIWDGTTISLFGGRNEVVSFNIVLEAGTALVEDVTIEFDDLVDGGSNHISSTPAVGNQVFDYVGRNIELFYVKYLPILGLSLTTYDNAYDERHVPIKLQRPYTGGGFAVPGTGWVDRPNAYKYYPDIAAPIEVIGAFDVAYGTNQQIWCDIYIPDTAGPSTFTGNLLVKVAGVTAYTVPISLEVLNFEVSDLPGLFFQASTYLQTADLNSRFLGVPYTLNPSQDATILPIRREFFKMFHRHRFGLWNDDVNAGYDGAPAGQPRAYWDEFLDGTAFSAASGYDGPGVDDPNWIYMIGAYGTWDWADSQAAFRAASDAWYTYMNANYPSIFTAVYLSDESPNFAQTQTWAGYIALNPGVGQNLKTIAALPWTDGQTDAYYLSVCATQFQWGVTATWDATFAYWSAYPKQAWLYNGQRELTGSMATEDEGVSPRVVMWSCFKKGINGHYIWAANYWNDYNNSDVKTHLWTDARTFGYYTADNTVKGRTGFLYSNGDGCLVYPGTDVIYPTESFGLAGPVASLRLKHYRRGIQDWTYLTLATAVDSYATNTIVSGLIPEVLWEYGVDDPLDPTYKRTDISWSVDPDDWETARRALAEIIMGSSPTSNTDVYVGSFSLNTSTGHQAITGVGFIPKGVIFLGTNRNGNGNAATASHCFGVCGASSSEWVASAKIEDNLLASNSQRYFNSTGVLSNYTTGSTLNYQAAIFSYDADGFTINITTAPGTACTIFYACFGGSAVAAKAGTFNSPASTGNTSFSGMGFEPDVVLFANTISTTTLGNQASAIFSIGAAKNATSRWLTALSANDGVTPTDSYSNQLTDACFGRFIPGDTRVLADYVSGDADGFTINYSVVNGTPTSGYFGLTADKTKVGSFAQYVATGPQSITGVGFQPKFLLLVSYAAVTNAGQIANARRSIGMASGPANMGAIGFASANSATPSNSSSRSRDDQIITMITEGGATPTVVGEAELVSLDADGFSLNWGVSDGTAREILYLAIG